MRDFHVHYILLLSRNPSIETRNRNSVGSIIRWYLCTRLYAKKKEQINHWDFEWSIIRRPGQPFFFTIFPLVRHTNWTISVLFIGVTVEIGVTSRKWNLCLFNPLLWQGHWAVPRIDLENTLLQPLGPVITNLLGGKWTYSPTKTWESTGHRSNFFQRIQEKRFECMRFAIHIATRFHHARITRRTIF